MREVTICTSVFSHSPLTLHKCNCAAIFFIVFVAFYIVVIVSVIAIVFGKALSNLMLAFVAKSLQQKCG